MRHPGLQTHSTKSRRGAGPSRASLFCGAGATFVGTFAYRWLNVFFTNDHFAHLTRGRQILLGEVPVRDFFDPGLFLQYYASAAALHLSGGLLLGEALLTIFFTSLGACLSYVLATRVSRSWVIGIATTAIAVATYPRLYAYPKVFLFVLVAVCAWRYTDRRTTLNLCLISVVTAVAFLFRHDHSLYIGISVMALLVILQWSESRNTTRSVIVTAATYVGVTTLLLLPYLVFIQSVVGIPRFLRGISPQAQAITTLRLNTLPLRFDWSAPLAEIDPAAERRINVRWTANTSDEARRDREHRYGLLRPIPDEGTTWTYVIANEGDGHNIAALISDSLVEDTNGIDRQHARVSITETTFHRLQRWIPLLRMRVAPGILTSSNAVAWLYYVMLILPFIAAVLMIRAWPHRHAAPDGSGDLAVVGMMIVLCLIVGQSLVREAPAIRLPDVATPMAVLGAWVAGVWARRGTPFVALQRMVAVVFWMMTFWGAATLGALGEHLVTSGLPLGAAGVMDRFAQVNQYLTTRPIDGWGDNGTVELRTMARWLLTCTAASDRLLVTWFAPDLPFYAERPFAGGQAYLVPDWHSSVEDEQLTVERLGRQRVPVVLSEVKSEPAIRRAFPIVFDYIDRRYALAARSTFGSSSEYDVFVDRAIPPRGTYEPFSLPCFR